MPLPWPWIILFMYCTVFLYLINIIILKKYYTSCIGSFKNRDQEQPEDVRGVICARSLRHRTPSPLPKNTKLSWTSLKCQISYSVAVLLWLYKGLTHFVGTQVGLEGAWFTHLEHSRVSHYAAFTKKLSPTGGVTDPRWIAGFCEGAIIICKKNSNRVY
jgi:hypothetical protein